MDSPLRIYSGASSGEDQIVPCQFFQRGLCPNGISCLYSHYQSKKARSSKLKAAYFVGRFDPFHLGQYETILEAQKYTERIFMVIDEGNQRHSTTSFQIRAQMITEAYQLPSCVTVVNRDDAEIICKSQKQALDWVKYKANIKNCPNNEIGEIVGSDRFRTYAQYPSHYLLGQTILISRKAKGQRLSASQDFQELCRMLHIATRSTDHSSTKVREALQLSEPYPGTTLGINRPHFDLIKQNCLYESDGYCIIADVGGTSVKFGWRKLDSDFLEWNHLRVDGVRYRDIFRNPNEAPKKLFQTALACSQIDTTEVVHFGISMSGLIDDTKQTIIRSDRLDELAHPKSYHNFSFEKELSQQIQSLGQRRKTWIVNDGIASALGSDIGHSKAIVITLGTYPAVTVIKQVQTNVVVVDKFEWGDCCVKVEEEAEEEKEWVPIWKALCGQILSRLSPKAASSRVGHSLFCLCERYIEVFKKQPDKIYITGGNSVKLQLLEIEDAFVEMFDGLQLTWKKPTIFKEDNTYDEQSKRHLAGCYNYFYLSMANLIKIKTNT